jgi:acetoin utilization deacetylase AcuC-like enzyme
MIASASLAIMAAQQNGFAVTRPPGHHATKEEAGGFCFFNNVAVATSYLISLGRRVCIVDIDGHHGNGTQSIFSKNGQVLFCSIHQNDVYPNVASPCCSSPQPKRKRGSMLDLGQGLSFKKVINIPLERDSGDDLFLRSLEFLRKYIAGFDPDVVAISAGFDGYFNDRLLSLNYTLRGYHEAGKFFASLGKPLFAVLEGGYHECVKECVEIFTNGINGDKLASDENLSSSPPQASEWCLKTLNGLSEILDSN